MSEKNSSSFTGKDEALLILEYLENEQMSRTFLNFLDENKYLTDLRARLYANYVNPNENDDGNDSEVNDFQAFFNQSMNLSKQTESIDSAFLTSPFPLNENLTDHTETSDDLFFDDDFLNVGLQDLISQTPPMDYCHDLPDTPVPSVPPSSTENEDFHSTLEQLFAMPCQPMSTPVQPIVQLVSDTNSKTSFTKCIVVTQDFLQSIYSQQQQQQQQPHHSTAATINSHPFSSFTRPKRRRRRLKVGKENCHQQRKLMPRTTSPSH